MRARGAALLVCSVVVTLSCSNELTPSFDADPSPTPAALDDGDARDGDLDVTTDLVINPCRVLESGAGMAMQLSSTLGVTAGDRLLVWQVQDVFAVPGTSASLALPELAGRWEIVLVEVESGAMVTLTSSAEHVYETNGGKRAQACRVPQYGSVTIQAGAALRASDWSEADGVGGVVALFATGTVTIDGAISADGAGFEGGEQGFGSTTAEDMEALEYPDRNGGAAKGGSLDGTARARFGRGALANGGGGGNAHNAGGGGGGNGGAGGGGGRQSVNSGSELAGTRGAGGAALNASPFERLALGGGGGAGDQDSCDAGFCVGGSDGGGAVLLFAGRIAGTGEIRAHGDDATADSADGADGAPGGGAGGTILVRARASAFTGAIAADGGDGGDAGPLGAGNYRGPGGGGGGGNLLTMGATGATHSAAPGLPGVNPGGTPPDDVWWAEGGGQGTVAPLPPP